VSTDETTTWQPGNHQFTGHDREPEKAGENPLLTTKSG